MGFEMAAFGVDLGAPMKQTSVNAPTCEVLWTTGARTA